METNKINFGKKKKKKKQRERKKTSEIKRITSFKGDHTSNKMNCSQQLPTLYSHKSR